MICPHLERDGGHDDDRGNITSWGQKRNIVLIRHSQYDSAAPASESNVILQQEFCLWPFVSLCLFYLFTFVGRQWKDLDAKGSSPGRVDWKVLQGFLLVISWATWTQNQGASVSGLTCAKETAVIIAEQLPGVKQAEPVLLLNQSSQARACCVWSDTQPSGTHWQYLYRDIISRTKSIF